MYKPHHRNAGGSETVYDTIGIEMIIVEMDQVGLDQFNLMGDPYTISGMTLIRLILSVIKFDQATDPLPWTRSVMLSR